MQWILNIINSIDQYVHTHAHTHVYVYVYIIIYIYHSIYSDRQVWMSHTSRPVSIFSVSGHVSARHRMRVPRAFADVQFAEGFRARPFPECHLNALACQCCPQCSVETPDKVANSCKAPRKCLEFGERFPMVSTLAGAWAARRAKRHESFCPAGTQDIGPVENTPVGWRRGTTS